MGNNYQKQYKVGLKGAFIIEYFLELLKILSGRTRFACFEVFQDCWLILNVLWLNSNPSTFDVSSYFLFQIFKQASPIHQIIKEQVKLFKLIIWDPKYAKWPEVQGVHKKVSIKPILIFWTWEGYF